jgi:hypothetical protein
MKFLRLFICLTYTIQEFYAANIMDNVVFAVNCGGEAHIDSNGMKKTNLILVDLGCF